MYYSIKEDKKWIKCNLPNHYQDYRVLETKLLDKPKIDRIIDSKPSKECIKGTSMKQIMHMYHLI